MKTVLILAGGPDSEREVSLKSGYALFEAMDRHKYEPILVDIETPSDWFIIDSFDYDKPHKKLRFNPFSYHRSFFTDDNDFKEYQIDIIVNTLHGKFGEGGYIQGVLEQTGIPYTGSGLEASAICMNKAFTNVIVSDLVKTPKELSYDGKTILVSNLINDLKNTFIKGQKIVIKPTSDGSSCGINIITYDPDNTDEFFKALSESTNNLQDRFLIQEFISGIEYTCPVLGSGLDTIALPVGEIGYQGEFFDFEAKYNASTTTEIFPAPISRQLTKHIQELSVEIHTKLGCRGITRSDFIVTENEEIYFLEINTNPGMTGSSLVPKSAHAFGWSFTELINQVILSCTK